MRLTLNKQSALKLLRTIRRNGTFTRRADLVDPDPSPHLRWGREVLAKALCARGLQAGDLESICVCVSGRGRRVQSRSVANTVYGGALPAGSFLDLGDGLRMSGPELLFVELANDLGFAEHLLLGFELCGTYSLDAADPARGSAAMDLPRATSVGRIARFL